MTSYLVVFVVTAIQSRNAFKQCFTQYFVYDSNLKGTAAVLLVLILPGNCELAAAPRPLIAS